MKLFIKMAAVFPLFFSSTTASVCDQYYYAQKLILDVYVGNNLMQSDQMIKAYTREFNYTSNGFMLDNIPPLKGFSQTGSIIHPNSSQFLLEIKSNCDSWKLGDVVVASRDSSLSGTQKSFTKINRQDTTIYVDTISTGNNTGIKDALLTKDSQGFLADKILKRDKMRATYIGYFRLDSIRDDNGTLTGLGMGYGYDSYQNLEEFYKRAADVQLVQPKPNAQSARELGLHVLTVEYDSVAPAVSPVFKPGKTFNNLMVTNDNGLFIIEPPRSAETNVVQIHTLNGMLIREIYSDGSVFKWDGTVHGTRVNRGLYLIKADNFTHKLYVP